MAGGGGFCWRVIAVTAATLLLVCAASASAATRVLSAQYRGKYSLKQDVTDAAGDYSHLEQTFTWTERVSTEFNGLVAGRSTKTLKVDGLFTQDAQQGATQAPVPPPSHVRCVVTELNTAEPYLVGLHVEPRGPGRVGVGAALPGTVGTQLTISKSPDCLPSGLWLLSNPSSATFTHEFPNDAQTKMFNDAFGAFSNSLRAEGGIKRYDTEQSAVVKGGTASNPSTETITRSMHSVISTGPGSLPPLGTGNGAAADGPAPPPKPTPAEKQAARADLRPAVDAAAGPCYQEGESLGLLGAGVLVIGSGPIIGGGLAIAGALTAPIVAPLCTSAIERIVADYRIYKDPPLPGIHLAARPAAVRAPALPSCARYRGAAGRFCAGLRADNARLVKAARHTTAVAKALETTVGRATAAKAAGDRSAIALQAATAKLLTSQFRGALRAQTSAGRRVAARLRGANLKWQLTAGQSAKGIQAVLTRLAPQAIGTAELSPVAASALQPGPVDLLARLAAPALAHHGGGAPQDGATPAPPAP